MMIIIIIKYLTNAHAEGGGKACLELTEPLIPSKKKQSLLIAKIRSRKTEKITNLQKQTRTKILCHTVR